MLKLAVGADKAFNSFDEAVTGCQEGQSRKQHIEPESAYGEWSVQ